MRTTNQHNSKRHEPLEGLAELDLSLAIAQGAARAHELRAEAFREALRQTGLGLSQLFGLGRRRQPPRRHRLSHG